jgi:hypothetical protein
MEDASGPRIDDTAARIRWMLRWTLFAAIPGTAVELLLLEHYEDIWQWLPLVLLAAGSAVLAWQSAGRRRAALWAFQLMMFLFVVSGGLGVVQHYQGNAEFELEMTPSLGGWELFRRTMTGATPVLAPGTMSLLGAIGLAYTYRYPRARP